MERRPENQYGGLLRFASREKRCDQLTNEIGDSQFRQVSAWDYLNPNISYGEITDSDGQVYKTVKIGNQTWMAQNLNYAYLGRTSTQDSSSFCYGNKKDSCGVFGRLYLWSAAMDSAGVVAGNSASGCGYGTADCSKKVHFRGFCPAGWHLPTSSEWSTLFEYVGENPGKKLKSREEISEWWLQTNTAANPDGLYFNGTDDYGFTILPAGYAELRSSGYSFYNVHQYTFLWAPSVGKPSGDTENGPCLAHMNNYSNGAASGCKEKYATFGYSVGCVKN